MESSGIEEIGVLLVPRDTLEVAPSFLGTMAVEDPRVTLAASTMAGVLTDTDLVAEVFLGDVVDSLGTHLPATMDDPEGQERPAEDILDKKL